MENVNANTVDAGKPAAKTVKPAAVKAAKAKAAKTPPNYAAAVERIISDLQPFDESGIMEARNAIHHLRASLTPLRQFAGKPN